MIKDYICFNNKKYQLSTIVVDGVTFETMIFPMENGVVSGREVYCFRTSCIGETERKRADIWFHPEKYLAEEKIREYKHQKEADFFKTDLQKFQDFFDDMNIQYKIAEHAGGILELFIETKHIYQQYGNGVSVVFRKSTGKFIRFEGWGE